MLFKINATIFNQINTFSYQFALSSAIYSVFFLVSLFLCVCVCIKVLLFVEEPIYNKNSRLKLISYFIVARCRLCFSLAKKKYCQRLSYKQKRTIFIVLTGVSWMRKLGFFLPCLHVACSVIILLLMIFILYVLFIHAYYVLGHYSIWRILW